jgi:outer membrane protein OmpA-like peptidoglycan-associated protein
MIDQAMQQRMVDVSKDDIKTILEGGKASDTAPLTTTASLDKKSPAKEAPITMEFKSRLTNLQSDQETALKTDILPRLKANPNQRLQIQAFASHNSNEESEARRISLARALAVRAFLLGNGIDPSRMDVRALGSNTTSKMTDRVDLVFLGQS